MAKEILEAVIYPPAGSYVVAVSGGVDSVCLLHMLAVANKGQWHLHVASFNHGLRPDAAEDVETVSGLAKELGLSFYTAVGQPKKLTEEEAREQRYGFLRMLKLNLNAA